jgi:hypothetical protein
LLGIYNSSSDDKKPSIEIKLTTTDDDDNDFLLDSSFNDDEDIDVDLALIDLKRLLMIFLVINSCRHNLRSQALLYGKPKIYFFIKFMAIAI